MNVRSQLSSAALPTTPDEFLRWNERQDGKWDFVAGGIVDMMVNVSRAHAMLCNRLLTAFAKTLIFPPYTVSSADFGVQTGHTVRYPDVMVDGGAGGLRDLAAAEPLLIAEVLSPSTLAIDFGPKTEEYKSIASLRYYLLLSQDEARVWLWSRDDSGEWPAAPAMVEGPDHNVPLPGLGLSLSLSELYAGIAPFG